MVEEEKESMTRIVLLVMGFVAIIIMLMILYVFFSVSAPGAS